MTDFYDELRKLINRFSKENESNSPDYILARYMLDCLSAYERAIKERDKWFAFEPFKDLK